MQEKEPQVNEKPGKSLAEMRYSPPPLSDRLAAVATDVRLRLTRYTRTMDSLVARLVQSGAGSAAPAVGDTFPDFVLPDAKGRLWHLSRALDDGPVVLSFHRGLWCNFCQVNMTVLAEISPLLKEAGCQIVAISPENADQSGELAAQAAADFPILCDIGFGVSTLLGLSFVVDDDMRRELGRLDVDLNAGNCGEGWILPISATFVLDATGSVVARHVDPDPRTRMDPDAILQAAAVCQSAARN
jgi:peroxiredoxin